MIHYINPNDVHLAARYPSKREIEQQISILNRQGQIEPLMATQHETGIWIVNNNDYPYAVAQVVAARILNWQTVALVSEDDSQ